MANKLPILQMKTRQQQCSKKRRASKKVVKERITAQSKQQKEMKHLEIVEYLCNICNMKTHPVIFQPRNVAKVN